MLKYSCWICPELLKVLQRAKVPSLPHVSCVLWEEATKHGSVVTVECTTVSKSLWDNIVAWCQGYCHVHERHAIHVNMQTVSSPVLHPYVYVAKLSCLCQKEHWVRHTMSFCKHKTMRFSQRHCLRKHKATLLLCKISAVHFCGSICEPFCDCT